MKSVESVKNHYLHTLPFSILLLMKSVIKKEETEVKKRVRYGDNGKPLTPLTALTERGWSGRGFACSTRKRAGAGIGQPAHPDSNQTHHARDAGGYRSPPC